MLLQIGGFSAEDAAFCWVLLLGLANKVTATIADMCFRDLKSKTAFGTSKTECAQASRVLQV